MNVGPARVEDTLRRAGAALAEQDARSRTTSPPILLVGNDAIRSDVAGDANVFELGLGEEGSTLVSSAFCLRRLAVSGWTLTSEMPCEYG